MAEQVTLEFLNGLVRLDTLPEEEWVGKAVYHPGAGQMGNTPYWRFCDECADDPSMRLVRFDPDEDPPEAEPDWEALIYDSGPVTEHREGPWGPEERRDVLFYVEVCMGESYDNVPNDNWPDGFNFVYGADNLWIEP